jgi:26S proteasome regulatory subunit N2
VLGCVECHHSYLLIDKNDQDEKPKAGTQADEHKPEEKADTESEEKPEPASESLSNLSRVTPVQLSFIAFSPAARYQPVRPIPNTPIVAPVIRKTKKAGDAAASGSRVLTGGGIILLRDTKPNEMADYIELNPNLEKPVPPTTVAAEAPAAAAVAEAAQVSDMDVDEGAEAEVPPPFEYPFGSEGA